MEQSGLMYIVLCSAALCLPICLACDGYQITNIKIARCDPKGEDIIKLTDLNIKLHDDCTANVIGCIELYKKITSATVTYLAKKDFFSLSGTKDICKELEEKEEKVKEGFEYAKVDPPRCPFDPMKVCGPQQPYNMTKFKSYLPMGKGKLSADIKLTTNTGNACIKATATIVKGKTG